MLRHGRNERRGSLGEPNSNSLPARVPKARISAQHVRLTTPLAGHAAPSGTCFGMMFLILVASLLGLLRHTPPASRRGARRRRPEPSCPDGLPKKGEVMSL